MKYNILFPSPNSCENLNRIINLLTSDHEFNLCIYLVCQCIHIIYICSQFISDLNKIWTIVIFLVIMIVKFCNWHLVEGWRKRKYLKGHRFSFSSQCTLTCTIPYHPCGLAHRLGQLHKNHGILIQREAEF